MTKNYMKEIAKMLGVELGEEFYLLTDKSTRFERAGKTCKFVFTESGGLRTNDRAENYNYLLVNLLMGKYHIEKTPFQPKYNEKYYTYVNERFNIVALYWTNTAYDYIRKHTGVVFRTEQEAEAARPVRYKKLTGKDWEKLNEWKF